MERELFDRLDADGYQEILAITHDRPPQAGSHSTPHAFVCAGGKTYWVKRQSQCGLASELIAGRLAGRVQAGPEARIIQVPRAALPAAGVADHLEGLGVGTLDCKGTVNSKEIQAVLSTAGAFDPSRVDAASRARAVTFNTWVGAAGDPQVLVDLGSGHVFTVDYGDCFCDVDQLADPAVIVAPIPGVSLDLGRGWPLVEDAVVKVEALDDDTLTEVVAKVPHGTEWNADPNRRFKIAEWLAHRRDGLREVMQAWAQ